MSIEITAVMLDHEGGTKFYEVVCLMNRESDKAYIIRRWGKMGLRNGTGGENKMESFMSISAAQQSLGKLVLSKQKGGYEKASATHNLHNGNMTVPLRDTNIKLLRNRIKQHYDSGTIADQALDALQIRLEAEVAQPKRKSNEPEPDRGSDWGAW